MDPHSRSPVPKFREVFAGTSIASRSRAMRDSITELGSAGASARSLHFVVLEGGAALPDQRGHEHDFHVVSMGRGAGASSAALTAKALRRVGRLERAGRRIDQAVISVGRDGRGPESARALLARALLVHQTRHGGSVLEFVAPADVEADVRRELLALVGTLTSELNAPVPVVRLRFVSPPALEPPPADRAERAPRPA